MVVFDFDGVMVKNRLFEKAWRWITNKMKIKKTPHIFFLLQELFELVFNIGPTPNKEILQSIKKLAAADYKIGLLTDRSLWSIISFLKENCGEICLTDFNFIQTRASFLNRFTEFSHLIGRLKNPQLCVSNRTKPDIDFADLKKFAANNNLSLKDILLVDDLPEFLKAAKFNGFSVVFPTH